MSQTIITRESARPADLPESAFAAFVVGAQKLPEVLNKFGWASLRPGQKDVVQTVMQGFDCVGILPTAAGKTGCYTVPALCMGWRTIIISPLLALMADQEALMQRMGVRAARITSDNMSAHASILNDWACGNLQVMLVSPERVSNPEWRSVVMQCPPDFIAMDEAHTFSQWADTFRSGYKFAGDFVREVNPKVVLALTATCPPEMELEIRAGLSIQNARRVFYYPQRRNLHLKTLDLRSPTQFAPWVAANCPGSTIVYAATRENVETMCADIQRYVGDHREVVYYHGGITSPSVKKDAQDRWTRSDDAIIVATNAFGMGIDKPNVRNVVHFDLPGTLSALTQECVHPESFISTASGQKPATEVVQGEIMLDFDFTTGKTLPAAVAATMENQTTRMREIRTKLGSTLRVTPTHPVFVLRGGSLEEVAASDVHTGDRLLAQLDMRPADTASPELLDWLSDCPEPVYVEVLAELVDLLRASLGVGEITNLFRLNRLYDYGAYKRGKCGRLSYWLDVIDAAGIPRAEFLRCVVAFKTRSSQKIRLPQRVGVELGWLAGIMATDGHIYRSSEGSGYGSWKVKLGNTNPSIIRKFESIVRSMGVNTHTYTRSADRNKLAKLSFEQSEASHPILVHVLSKMGVPHGKKSYTVVVPTWLRSADAPVRAAFLAGVIDGDGCLDSARYKVRVHSASWDFLSGVGALLRGFAIPATFSPEDYTSKAAVMVASSTHGYSLCVTSTEHYEMLKDLVTPYACKSFHATRPPNPGQDMTAQRRSRRVGMLVAGDYWLEDAVLEISDIAYSGPVLNWRVEPGNQLVVDGVLTHNCGRAGRDGLDSNCWAYPNPKSITTQKYFIRIGNPTEENVRSVLRQFRTMQDMDGTIHANRQVVAQRAGVDHKLMGAVMTFMYGERLVEEVKEAGKPARIKWAESIPSFTPAEAQTRDALADVSRSVDGWLEFDIEELAKRLNLKPDTVGSRLTSLAGKGLVTYVRTDSRKPIRIIGDVDTIDFTRINMKAAEAQQKLDEVIAYCDVPDEDKQDYLSRTMKTNEAAPTV